MFGTDCRLVFNVIGSFGFPTLHRPRRSSLDPSILSILGSGPQWFDVFVPIFHLRFLNTMTMGKPTNLAILQVSLQTFLDGR